MALRGKEGTRQSWPNLWAGANSFAPRLLRDDDFRGRRLGEH